MPPSCRSIILGASSTARARASRRGRRGRRRGRRTAARACPRRRPRRSRRRRAGRRGWSAPSTARRGCGPAGPRGAGAARRRRTARGASRPGSRARRFRRARRATTRRAFRDVHQRDAAQIYVAIRFGAVANHRRGSCRRRATHAVPDENELRRFSLRSRRRRAGFRRHAKAPNHRARRARDVARQSLRREVRFRAGRSRLAVPPRVERDEKNARVCLLYTSPSPRDKRQSRMPSSA